MPSDGLALAQRMMDSLFAFNTYEAGSVVPTTYDDYARVLHPARGNDGIVRWSEIARWSGRTYHPAMQFEAIAEPVAGRAPAPPPWDGTLPAPLHLADVRALARVLSAFTATPSTVWCLVWDGYGDLPPSVGPRVVRPQRSYRLHLCTLAEIQTRQAPVGHPEPPEYWFPEDAAWCVATDMDLFWTYVGGTRACVGAVLSCGELEALRADLHDGLTVESDEINRLTPLERQRWERAPSPVRGDDDRSRRTKPLPRALPPATPDRRRATSQSVRLRE